MQGNGQIKSSFTKHDTFSFPPEGLATPTERVAKKVAKRVAWPSRP